MTTAVLPTPPMIIAADLAAANVANQANAVTGIYGITGTGKSSLADTAAEYTWETFKKITLCYAADLGGFGNKRLTLIRAGIMRVWDPRNHVNAFETMELLSLGAFPAALIDPERGYADPAVPLILPRRVVYSLICPQGHVAATFDHEAVLNASSVACPTCAVVTTISNCTRIDKAIVRHRLFKDVGFRIYDSMTALNDWGMADLQAQSAKGTLPTGNSGGSLLGAADALRSGIFTFGSSSVSQYGFLQNRTYGWLTNIRAIPDQVLPAVATFMVEQSKGNDESGGEMILGPKIAGNARTAALGGWLGNLLHATKEPNKDDVMVHRLWLTNHIDPRDPRKIPYIAKHRGTPLGMPTYLEDAPGEPPWSGCSLKVFFTKLQAQLVLLDQQTKRDYPDAPGLFVADAGDAPADEIVGTVAASASTPAPLPVTGGRTIGRRTAIGRRPTTTPTVAASAGTPVGVVGVQSPATSTSPEGAGTAPSVIVSQLEASLAAQASQGAAAAVGPGERVEAPAADLASRSAPAMPAMPAALTLPPATPAGPPTSRIRRVPRPPV